MYAFHLISRFWCSWHEKLSCIHNHTYILQKDLILISLVSIIKNKVDNQNCDINAYQRIPTNKCKTECISIPKKKIHFCLVHERQNGICIFSGWILTKMLPIQIGHDSNNTHKNQLDYWKRQNICSRCIDRC